MNNGGRWILLAVATMFLADMAQPALGGNLNPPGTPGSTMHTLEDIYTIIVQDTNSKVDGGGANGQALVPRSGSGTTMYAEGDDGNLQKGVTWPVPRFTDNNDGTVTDNLTGLIWLKNANCYGEQPYGYATAVALTLKDGTCDLSDGSSAGDWRLPHIKELHSLIAAEYQAPALSNTAGTGKWSEGDPFSGVNTGWSYWSSSVIVSNGSAIAWKVYLYNGGVDGGDKNSGNFVWPVRDGQ